MITELQWVPGILPPGIMPKFKLLSALTMCLALLACDGKSGGDNSAGPALNFTPDTIEASRFLTQASFGPTAQSIAELTQIDLASWIERQMSLPISEISPYVQINSNGSSPEARHEIWWQNAIHGEDQLRQRVAYALSQIFVLSDIDYVLANNQYSISDYYDMLAKNAFGNYRELLGQVTLHPAMGVYLSMLRNEKADSARNVRPDENYAREVLQLFSIGLVELDSAGQAIPIDNPTPAYSQKTVEEFARVFTGWNYHSAVDWTTTSAVDPLEQPMKPDEAFHDTGTKTLLNGQVIPAGLDARADLDAALDNIFAHQNVGPFIASALIKRLVTSNPTPAYIQRVAAKFADNGQGVRGDLGATVRAILLDSEARNGHLELNQFGKLKEPIIKLIQYYRALEAVPGDTASGNYASTRVPAYRIDELVGQAFLRSKSVFNFYQPDNPTSGQEIGSNGQVLTAPEQQIYSEARVANTNNDTHSTVYLHHNLSGISSSAARINASLLIQLFRQSPDNLLNHLNLVLLAGHLSDNFRALLLEHMYTIAESPGLDQAAEPIPVDDETATQIVLDIAYMILASPEYMVQR